MHFGKWTKVCHLVLPVLPESNESLRTCQGPCPEEGVFVSSDVGQCADGGCSGALCLCTEGGLGNGWELLV